LNDETPPGVKTFGDKGGSQKLLGDGRRGRKKLWTKGDWGEGGTSHGRGKGGTHASLVKEEEGRRVTIERNKNASHQGLYWLTKGGEKPERE